MSTKGKKPTRTGFQKSMWLTTQESRVGKSGPARQKQKDLEKAGTSIPLQRGLSPGPAQPLDKDCSRPHVSLGWLKIPCFAVRASWDLGNAKFPSPATYFALLLVWDPGKDECGWREPPLPAYHWEIQAALEKQLVEILLPPQLLSRLKPCAPAATNHRQSL